MPKKSSALVSMICIIVPVLIFIITVIASVTASLLEFPTNRGDVYTLFAMISLLSIILAPIPCIIISIIGTLCAAKSFKEKCKGAIWLLTAGIAETLAEILVFSFILVPVYIGWQGI